MAADEGLAVSRFGRGASVVCIYCGLRIYENTICADRLLPPGFGGGYEQENLVPACAFCNKARQDREDIPSFEEFLADAGPSGALEQELGPAKGRPLGYDQRGDDFCIWDPPSYEGVPDVIEGTLFHRQVGKIGLSFLIEAICVDPDCVEML